MKTVASPAAVSTRPRNDPRSGLVWCWSVGWFVLLVFGGCGPAPEPEPTTIEDAWHRIDLWQELVGRGLPEGVEATLEPLADPEGLGRSRVPGRVRALATPLGQRLSWELDLGRQPSLRFIPLRAGSGPECPYRYRVGVRTDDDRLHELASHPQPLVPPRWTAPAAIDLSLSEFAEQRVTLLLQAVPWFAGCPLDTAPPALWGQPGVVHRAAIPVPTDGDDEAAEPTAPLPNLVLVSFDALRADAVGAQESGLASPTPNLDRLAEEALVFESAFSTFNGTNPSFASIFTGLYGKNHGVYDLRTPLPDEHGTLAERLAEAGYATGAVVSAHHLRGENSGLDQGFDHFVAPETLFAPELAVDLAIEWLVEREGPFFLWLHLFEPHTPHRPPRPFGDGFRPEPSGLDPPTEWRAFRPSGAIAAPRRRQLGGHEALYAGEVAAADHQLGRLLAWLESRELLADGGVLAVVSDHGENLLERSEGPDAAVAFRHVGLWDSTLHVPLLLAGPGLPSDLRGRRTTDLVQTLDLFPTLLAMAGLTPSASDGVDLLTLARDPTQGRRVVFAEHMSGQGEAIRSPDGLLARYRDQPVLGTGERLYDLVADPGQQMALPSDSEAHRRLALALDAWLADRRPGPGTQQRPLDDTERKQLEALGYIDP